MSNTQQPEALRLARKFEEVGFMGDHRFAKDHWCRQAAAELRHQHARIADLESRLSAIGAGGVEAPASPVSTYVEVRECSDCGHVGINDADGSKAACNTCEWYGDSPHEDKCPGCNRVGTMTAACPKCGSRTLLLAETHLLAAAAQGLGLANCKGGKWLTVVYRDIQPGDESRTIGEHPKVSALSWSHALHDRDTALAAQAKQGERS